LLMERERKPSGEMHITNSVGAADDYFTSASAPSFLDQLHDLTKLKLYFSFRVPYLQRDSRLHQEPC
jgi:hypothetical protein